MMKNKVIRSLSIFCLLLMFQSSSYAQKSTKQKPLLIIEQGSFAVGGTIITNPGTFDPYKPTPEGQTFRGDPRLYFLSNSCKGSQISIGDVARYRSVF